MKSKFSDELITAGQWSREENVPATTRWRWQKEGRLEPVTTIAGTPYFKRGQKPKTDAEMAARQQGDAA